MLFYIWTFYLLLRFTACDSHVLNYDSVTICDGMEKVVRCPSKENIHVLQGFYGKWKNHDCNGIKADPPNTRTCSKDRKETTNQVRSKCQGQNQCTFIADKKFYGNPCPNSKAYLYITFFCMAPGKHIDHTKDKNNNEIVTVLSHGYLVSEKKYSAAETGKPDVSAAEVESSEKTSVEENSNHGKELERKILIPTPRDEATEAEKSVEEVASTPAQVLYDRNNIPSDSSENGTHEKKEEKEEPLLRSTTICNGQSKLVACLPGDGIKIDSAFYGKKSGKDCNGDLPYKDDAPTCSALDAKSNVQGSCDGKQTCLLFADENIYGKSLCPNVNKYLQLEYLCLPLSQLADVIKKPPDAPIEEEIREEDATSRSTEPEKGTKNVTVQVCNGERHTISCKHDVGMQIIAAFYGKINGKDCRGDLGYRDDIPDCVNPRALDSVKFLCENRKSCELASEKELFGDDVCSGVNKYLEVTYQC